MCGRGRRVFGLIAVLTENSVWEVVLAKVVHAHRKAFKAEGREAWATRLLALLRLVRGLRPGLSPAALAVPPVAGEQCISPAPCVPSTSSRWRRRWSGPSRSP